MAIAILPAAGQSTRMGRPKLLLPFGTSTIVGSAVEALRAAGVGRIVLVRAPGASDLDAWARTERLEVAINPHPERGMLSSILAGLDLLGGSEVIASGGEPIVISPADMPAIRPSSIRALVSAHLASDRPLAVGTFHGKRGHPLVIAPTLASHLGDLDTNVGLKHLLASGHGLLELELDDPGVVRDVDTPADYRALQAELESDRIRAQKETRDP